MGRLFRMIVYARFLALPIFWIVAGVLWWDTEPIVRPLAVFFALHVGYGLLRTADEVWFPLPVAAAAPPRWWDRIVLTVLLLPPVLVFLAVAWALVSTVIAA